MSYKKRLLELISKREEMCNEPFNYGPLYAWLEEIHYLFEKLDFSSTISSRIIAAIEQIFNFTDDKETLEERILQVNAKLFVFEKYEAEKLRES